MKKMIGVVALAICVLAQAVAQKIPAGRDLFVLAYEFAQDKTDAWTDAKISKFDIMNNEYVVSGYCVQKIMVGFQKQSYDVILKSDKDTLSVTVENMESVACDKEGKATKGAKVMANPKSTMTKLAGLIQKDLAGRISSWTDEEYAAKYDKVVSDPAVINCLANTTSSLYTSKFVEKNALIGKTISWNVSVSDIEENKPSDSLKKTVDKFDSELPEEYKYAYKLRGYYNASDIIYAGTVDTLGLINKTENILITFLSNDDNLIMLTEGKDYTIKGSIKNIRFDKVTGKLSWIDIWE